MMYIKFITLFCIFGTTSFIGVLISRKYKDRVRELQDMKKALSMFATKIKFTYEPLPEVFDEISKKFTGNIGKIFRNASDKMETKSADVAWNESIEEADSSLKKEDYEVLAGLGKLLGKTDLDGQINEIELANVFLDTQINSAKKEDEKSEKLYKTLRSGYRACHCYCFSLKKKGARNKWI